MSARMIVKLALSVVVASVVLAALVGSPADVFCRERTLR